jgi:hypothetical protein
MSAEMIESDTPVPGLPEPTWRSSDAKAWADRALEAWRDEEVISIKTVRRLLALSYDHGADMARLRGARS